MIAKIKDKFIRFCRWIWQECKDIKTFLLFLLVHLESTVEQFVTELSTEKREQLFAEVAAGADAAVVRN